MEDLKLCPRCGATASVSFRSIDVVNGGCLLDALVATTLIERYTHLRKNSMRYVEHIRKKKLLNDGTSVLNI